MYRKLKGVYLFPRDMSLFLFLLFLLRWTLCISNGNEENEIELKLKIISSLIYNGIIVYQWSCAFDTRGGGGFYWLVLTLNSAWIGNHMYSTLWDEITYPFSNSNGCSNWAGSLVWIKHQWRVAIMKAFIPVSYSSGTVANAGKCMGWASYQIRKNANAGCACAENAGNVFPVTNFFPPKETTS